MSLELCKIMVAETDPSVMEMLVAALARRLDAHITCVGDPESCLDVEMSNPHDLALVETGGASWSGLRLARQLLSLGNRPVILTGCDPTVDDVIDAMRIGVIDFFKRPFHLTELLESVERALRRHETVNRRLRKYRRMREMVRQAIRDRRNLNRRTELVCRDLVGAHRRLVHQVVNLQNARTTSPQPPLDADSDAHRIPEDR